MPIYSSLHLSESTTLKVSKVGKPRSAITGIYRSNVTGNTVANKNIPEDDPFTVVSEGTRTSQVPKRQEHKIGYSQQKNSHINYFTVFFKSSECVSHHRQQQKTRHNKSLPKKARQLITAY